MAQATPTPTLLKKAVHHHKAASKRGALERLFTMWFQGFVYNQIWEDPRVDAEAMQLGPGSRILTISSGGCNVLNYLLHDPEKIVAIDLNTSHMNLTRLKLAAVKHLPNYQAFYQFFGLGQHPDNVGNYYTYIREHLEPSTRDFWETGNWAQRRLGRKRIKYFKRGLYNQSKLGKFLSLIHRVTRITRRDPRRLLQATTLQEQTRIFEADFDPLFDLGIVRWFSRMPVSVYSLGIPPSQHQVMNDESGGRIVEVFRQRVRKLATGFPLSENYFAWQAFGRSYDHRHRQALPDYLREENYETLKQRVDRVETHITTLQNFLSQQPKGSLNRFVLLDSQDWMPPAVIAELWGLIADVGSPGTRVIFRTAGEASPIEKALPPELMRRFVYEQEISRALHEQDRSAIYGMFHLYRKPGE